MIKTNAVRVLDRLAIRYEYDVNSIDLSAETVAAKDGLPPVQVFKTLAVRRDRNGICLAVISADPELDFKALAHKRGSEDPRNGSFERSASPDRLPSRRSNRSGMQEGLPSMRQRACGNLRRDLGVCRHRKTADRAGSF
jgi:hypothetical protein